MNWNKVDIIILSYAKNLALQEMTEQTISSLINSEKSNQVYFDILVIETNKNISPYQYSHSTTIYPQESFGFHRYLNIGIKMTKNSFVCMCNNDLFFHENWASEILAEMQRDPQLMSASPFCTFSHPKVGYQQNSGNIYGYKVGSDIAGWCIFVRREIFEKIGLLDERFKFWYCDNDYAKTLEKFNIKHTLVTSSLVDHLEGKTTSTLDEVAQKSLTNEQHWYYQYKWEHRNILLYIYRVARSKIRLIRLKMLSKLKTYLTAQSDL
jgi:GT2 family glycosyltransferase